jgi:hypothetical protein
MRSLRVVWLALMFIVMIAPGLVSAQADEALEFVTQALDKLAALESYHFTAETILSSELSDEDGTVSANTNVYTSEGDALQNGDNATTFSVSTAIGDGALNPPVEVERIVANGTAYMNFHLEDSPYEEDLGEIEPGWWRYDDLRARFEGEALAYALDNFVSLPLPMQMPTLSADFIAEVREVEPETVDGQAMRVFEIELDALQLLLDQSSFTSSGVDLLAEIVETTNMLETGELEASLRLWVGADDAQIYRAEGESKTYIPYLTSGNEGIFPYNMRTFLSFSFTLSEHGQPVEISAPSPLNQP